MSASPAALQALLWRPTSDAGGAALPFVRPAPLAIEIGFGGGEALAWWAQRRPEWNLLGFERAQESVARAAALLHAAGLAGRVRLVHGDARHLLRELVPPGAAQRVWMQFPMPWPKARHAKHRLTDAAFLGALASALAPTGRFDLVTDQEVFARELGDGLREQGAFALGPLERDPPREFRTRYERRWLRAGRSIWRLTATPRAARAQAPRSSPTAMDHLHLDLLPTAERVRALAGQRWHDDEGTREVQEVFQAADGWLLLVVTAEAGFAQRFFLRLRLDAKPLLRVEDCARPYLTPGVARLMSEVRANLTAP